MLGIEFKRGQERVKNEEHDRRPRTSITNENIHAVQDILFDQQGILLINFKHERRTINAAYYYELLTKVRNAYRGKRRKQRIREVILFMTMPDPNLQFLQCQN